MGSIYFTFPAKGQPYSERDYVRRLVGDVDGSSAEGNDPSEFSFLLTDSDIDAFLSRSGGDVYLAASRLCLALAASNLIQARAVKLGQFETTNDAEEHWLTLSQRYQEVSNLNAVPVDSAVAWTENDMPELFLYRSLKELVP